MGKITGFAQAGTLSISTWLPAASNPGGRRGVGFRRSVAGLCLRESCWLTDLALARVLAQAALAKTGGDAIGTKKRAPRFSAPDLHKYQFQKYQGVKDCGCSLDWPFVALDFDHWSFDSRKLYSNSRDSWHGYMHARAADSRHLYGDWGAIGTGKAEILASGKLHAGQPGFDLSFDPCAIGFEPGHSRLFAGGQGLQIIELGLRLVQ